MSHPPTVSIVIPARDAGKTLGRTLASITRQTLKPREVIILDDGSRNPVENMDAVNTFPDVPELRVIRLDASRGPAVARNAGAAIARSDILLFVDADVVLHRDLIRRITDTFAGNGSISAVQGMYSEQLPDGAGTTSRYQNHYYFHAFRQLDPHDAAVCATFCFSIKRSVFESMGGFDARIPRPTVEDEAFGYALAAAGHKIFLHHGVRVTHLADYTPDRLIIRKFRMSFHQVKSALRGVRPPVGGSGASNRTHHARDILAAVILAPFIPVAWAWTWPAGLLLLTGYVGANARFWRYLTKQEPPVYMVEMLALTWVDQTAIACGLLFGALDYAMGRRY